MNKDLNDKFNLVRQIFGVDAVVAICKEVDKELKDVKIEGRGNDRARLMLSGYNVAIVSKVARYKRVGFTSGGYTSFTKMFPGPFEELLENKIDMFVKDNISKKTFDSAEEEKAIKKLKRKLISVDFNI